MRDHIQIILSFKLTKKGNQAFYTTLYMSFRILFRYIIIKLILIWARRAHNKMTVAS